MNLRMIGNISETKEIINDAGHCGRVAVYAYNTALRLRLNEDTCNDILLAAQHHDDGKAYLVDSIINKHGTLTKEEFEHVKLHVLYSSALAIEKGYNMNVIKYIFHHHEDYEGEGGYPSGLKGNDIPFGARIIRVCDVYDALTNDRVYRPKLYKDEAIKFLINNKKLFDPDILTVFISYLCKNSNVQRFSKTNMVLDSGTQGGNL